MWRASWLGGPSWQGLLLLRRLAAACEAGDTLPTFWSVLAFVAPFRGCGQPLLAQCQGFHSRLPEQSGITDSRAGMG